MNKLSITFQQKDQCEIWRQLANWFLKNYDFIHVNSTVAGKYNKHKQGGSHLRFPIRMILAPVDLQVTSILSMNLAILDFQSNNLSYFRSTSHPNASYQVSIQFRRRSEKKIFRMAVMVAILDF